MAVKNNTPAVRFLRYKLTSDAEAGTHSLHNFDLAKDLSMVNRRLYRQGRDYHVKKITILASTVPNGANGVKINAIPSSWVARQGWNRGFNVWKAMQKEATKNAQTNDVTATWHDFKLYLDYTSSISAHAAPIDSADNPYVAGEWNASTFTTPDGTAASDSFYATMMGDHQGAAPNRISVSLIKSYGESRRTVQPDDPNVQPDFYDDPLVNVFDYGTAIDEVLADLVDENDNPPYDLNAYPGDNANGPAPNTVQNSAIVDGRCSISGFTAMCGLLQVELFAALPAQVYEVLIELAPGKFRGIKAEAI